jgi:hypothetical protein
MQIVANKKTGEFIGNISNVNYRRIVNLLSALGMTENDCKWFTIATKKGQKGTIPTNRKNQEI